MGSALEPSLPESVTGEVKYDDGAVVYMNGTQILRTPPDVLIGFLKAWDEIAVEESAKNPFFKRVLDSQREYASKVVPAKRFMFPPYSFAANYYWPEDRASGGAGKGEGKKK